MAKPYSDDFREKVIQAIKLDGLNKSEASQLFNISRNTINLWCQRKAQTGDIKPKANGDKTQTEMVELWDGEISQRTISRALQKIRHTHKKIYGYCQRDEAKRATFLTQLENPKAPHLVYVDDMKPVNNFTISNTSLP